ncbi:uncharacterized protein Bfra_008294 [Botrytis fragariae]|uniref:Uncharacterized protein n=1 Tax=Botrytis fragariae TaxID=1964551 RepID=A0A8H6EI11_9HELO|nr:uncharacterized protein Bfra_008294 [Botrytis fragariae]KAF5873017.1 hypothetical protein Bfra_008294 [Botrytis fragariae]
MICLEKINSKTLFNSFTVKRTHDVGFPPPTSYTLPLDIPYDWCTREIDIKSQTLNDYTQESSEASRRNCLYSPMQNLGMKSCTLMRSKSYMYIRSFIGNHTNSQRVHEQQRIDGEQKKWESPTHGISTR